MLTYGEISKKAEEKGIFPQELGLGLLHYPEILQAYLEGEVIEHFYMDAWHTDDDPTFLPNRKYRVKPLEFECWEVILPEYSWVAMDRNGVWKAFTCKPKQYVDSWLGLTKYTELRCLVMPEVSDWKQSLIERPVGE